MKPKVKNDHNVLQVMALSGEVTRDITGGSRSSSSLIPEIIGDTSENEDSLKEVVTYCT